MAACVYTHTLPALIGEIAAAPAMQRLRHVGMHCGCEYAAFAVYRQARAPYSRFSHSLGAAGIVWHFTHDFRQSVAALLHDIATPCFAHTVDFLNGDSLRQESTEADTGARIAASHGIMAALNRAGIDLADVADYHRYPVADNARPALSADRLEYMLGDGWRMFGWTGAQAAYDDLFIAQNAQGAPEMCFAHLDAARNFARVSLQVARLYASPEDRFAMQALAALLRAALDAGAIAWDDLLDTEPQLIARLQAHPATCEAWRRYTALRAVRVTAQRPAEGYSVRVPVKRRVIDPLVKTAGQPVRLTQLDADYRAAVAAFLGESFDGWLSAGEE